MTNEIAEKLVEELIEKANIKETYENRDDSIVWSQSREDKAIDDYNKIKDLIIALMTDDDSREKAMLNIIEREGISYKAGKMLRQDSEVEINITDGTVKICDYSEERGSAEEIETICDDYEVDKDKVISICNKNGWGYVI